MYPYWAKTYRYFFWNYNQIDSIRYFSNNIVFIGYKWTLNYTLLDGEVIHNSLQ